MIICTRFMLLQRRHKCTNITVIRDDLDHHHNSHSSLLSIISKCVIVSKSPINVLNKGQILSPWIWSFGHVITFSLYYTLLLDITQNMFCGLLSLNSCWTIFAHDIFSVGRLQYKAVPSCAHISDGCDLSAECFYLNICLSLFDPPDVSCKHL